jgi:hypothetical protein
VVQQQRHGAVRPRQQEGASERGSDEGAGDVGNWDGEGAGVAGSHPRPANAIAAARQTGGQRARGVERQHSQLSGVATSQQAEERKPIINRVDWRCLYLIAARRIKLLAVHASADGVG